MKIKWDHCEIVRFSKEGVSELTESVEIKGWYKLGMGKEINMGDVNVKARY